MGLLGTSLDSLGLLLIQGIPGDSWKLVATLWDSWGILETLEDLLRTSRDSWGPHRYLGVSQESMGFLGTPGDSVEPYMTSWDS